MSGFDAFPLFSPSQVSRNKEKVLHSVFSPSFGGAAIRRLDNSALTAVTTDNTCDSPSACRDGYSANVVSCGSKSNVGKINSDSGIGGETAVGDRLLSSTNVEEQKVTALAMRTQRLNHPPGSALRGRRDRHNEGIPRSVTFRPDTQYDEKCTLGDMDSFRSPGCSARDQNVDDMSSPHLFMSPIPVVDDCSRSQALSIRSTHTTTSWHSVPIEMLNIEFVANCESEHQLEQIISALREASPAKYPALLRMAGTRLEALRSIAPKVDHNDAPHLELSRSRLVGSTFESNEESSLDISTSINDGYVEEHCEEAPSPKHDGRHLTEVEGCGNSCAFEGNVNGDTERHTTFSGLKEDLSTVLAAHSSMSAELDDALVDRGRAQKELKTQTRICRDLERKIKNQNEDLCAKIASLDQAKDEAQADVATLEDTLVSSSTKAREVASQLSKRTEEVIKLREEIQKVKDTAATELAGHQNLHKTLREKIEALLSQLAVQEKNAEDKLEMLEQKLKHDFDRVLERQKEQIAKMNENLNEARCSINILKRKNSQLSLKRIGTGTSPGNSDSDLLRQYNDTLARAKSTEMAASAMARALALSENELAEAKEGRDVCEKKCAQLIEANTNLKRENKELSGLLNQVNQELASSDVYVDKILDELEALKEGDSDKVRKMKEEMMHREKKFHSEVHQLQSQIKNQESWVSMEAYQKVLRESKTLSKLRSCMDSEIKELSRRNHQLERMAKTPVELPGKPMGPNTAATTKGGSINATLVLKESSNKVSPPKKVTPSSTPIPGKSLARMSAVRAAGGRAALSAKLKKTRGSVLRRNHQVQGQQQVDSQCQTHGATKAAASWPVVPDKENLQFYR